MTNVGTQQPGGRTAVAEGPGSQTAIASSTSAPPGSDAEKLLQQQQLQVNQLLTSVGRRLKQSAGRKLLQSTGPHSQRSK